MTAAAGPACEFMTVRQISKYLGIHELTAWRFCKEGRFKCFRVGSRWRTKKEWLDAYLQSTVQEQVSQ